MNGNHQIRAINIGPREQRKRLAFGIGAFVIAIIAFIFMIMLGVSRWWRIPLFIPLLTATEGIFQAKDKT